MTIFGVVSAHVFLRARPAITTAAASVRPVEHGSPKKKSADAG